MKLLDKRGQNTGEYAILFAVVLGSIVAMQSYVKGRIAGKIQTEADKFSTATYNAPQDGGGHSDSTLDFTSAGAGSVTQKGGGTQTITAPE